MLFKTKTMVGLYMPKWLARTPAEETNYWKKRISDDLRDGGKIFGSEVVKIVNLDGVDAAMIEAEEISSQGKILVEFK